MFYLYSKLGRGATHRLFEIVNRRPGSGPEIRSNWRGPRGLPRFRHPFGQRERSESARGLSAAIASRIGEARQDVLAETIEYHSHAAAGFQGLAGVLTFAIGRADVVANFGADGRAQSRDAQFA